MNILKYIIGKLITPAVLVLVWFFNFKPFSLIVYWFDSILKEPITKDEIPLSAYGAIDIAVLAFLINILLDGFKVMKKPIKIAAKIVNSGIEKNLIMIPETGIGEMNPIYANVEISCEVNKKFYPVLNYLSHLRIRIIWHGKWLSVTPDFFSATGFLDIKQKPGEISFDLMNYLSESDPRALFHGKLGIQLNEPKKRNGNICTKVKLDFGNVFVNILLSWVTTKMLINTEISDCEITIIS